MPSWKENNLIKRAKNLKEASTLSYKTKDGEVLNFYNDENFPVSLNEIPYKNDFDLYKRVYLSNSIEAINMKTLNKKYVYPLGEIVGIKATTDGVLVIGYEEENIEYIGGIEKGDNIIVSKYSGTEVKYEGEEYLIVKQEDILAIVE